MSKQHELQLALNAIGIAWNETQARIWEVQEYRTHCPVQPKHNPLQPQLSLQSKPCHDFKVYVYPVNNVSLSVVQQEILSIVQRSPYYTRDPEEACLFVPSVDTSCWCEECMHNGFYNIIHEPHPASQTISNNLAALPFWNEGRNHILFELSDAPCMPYSTGYAISAKSGLSEFHLRKGLDISLPLFGMVEFTAEQRHTPPGSRRFLLTFRGTRSERSDAMRNELYRIHNGEDIVLLIACRWFGQSYFQDYIVPDDTCKEQEASFQQFTFTELSVESKFALIVEGFGYSSFRLVEMMSAGSIPVICVDHYVLPYADILDWENFSIRVPEHKFEQVNVLFSMGSNDMWP